MSLSDLLIFGGVVVGASALAYVVSKPEDNTNKDLLKETFYCYRCHDIHRVDHKHIVFRNSNHKDAKKSRTNEQESIRISEIES